MNQHVLDRPVWNALRTRQSEFAIGNERARRFLSEISLLTGTRDDEPESQAQLAELVKDSGPLIVLQVAPVRVQAGLRILSNATCIQMTADHLSGDAGALEGRIEPLGQSDWKEMHALAGLTKPGPFEAQTPRLGSFWGIRENGVLLAMAGERMKMPGHHEVSGVCSHPDARGRGYARALSAYVAARILARGETPFLHAYTTNVAAIRLYETLGFRARTEVNVVALAHAITRVARRTEVVGFCAGSKSSDECEVRVQVREQKTDPELMHVRRIKPLHRIDNLLFQIIVRLINLVDM
jgi:predicted GNAT family acetyltransferase